MVSKKDMERFDKDSELWDSKQLGASAEHAHSASDEQQQALDEATGLQLLSIRMPKALIEQIKQLAKLEGLGYQPYMRQVMIKHVRENEYKLEQLLTPSEAVEKGDELFAQAINIKGTIETLPPLSNERIIAEGDYNKALTQSNALFCNAYEKCGDPVLKQHIKLRLSQIGAILDEELQAEHDKKNGRKQAS